MVTSKSNQFDLVAFWTNSNNLNHLYSCSNFTFATQIKSN